MALFFVYCGTEFEGALFIISLLILFSKERSTKKISVVAAPVMIPNLAIRCGNDTGESVHDSQGLLFI